MAFTEEDLTRMQEEEEATMLAEKEAVDKVAAEKLAAKGGGEKTPEELEEEKKAADEEAARKAALEAESKKGKEGETEEDEVRDLKGKLAYQTGEIEKLKKFNEAMRDKLVKAGLITEEEEVARKDAEEKAKAAYEAKTADLEKILELTSLAPAYTDVKEVVTQGNFDSMVSAMAKYYVSQYGGDVDKTTLQIESDIWKMPNPYKFMYDLIKQYHPAYKKKEEESTDEGKKKEKEESGGKKKEETAESLAKLPGGAGKGVSSGWSSAKIDALDEDELSTVPREIYEKYLQGTLD